MGGRGPSPNEPAPLEDALIGASATLSDTVTDAMTARAVGSGDVDVLSTPTLLALIERAAVASVAGRLPDGTTSVGVSIRLIHLEPAPVGATVQVTASVERIRARRLHFIFTAFDATGEIAGGHHVRAVVDRARFEASAAGRSSDAPAEP